MPLRVPEGEPDHTLVSKPDQPREGPDDFRMNKSEVPVDDFNLSMEVETPDQVVMSFVCSKRKQTNNKKCSTAAKGFTSGKDRDHKENQHSC